MAVQPSLTAYGISDALLNVFPTPIAAQRAPSTTDFAQIGQVWVNVATGDAYMLTMIASNSASWDQINQGSSGSFTSVTINPGNLTIVAGNEIITAGNLTVSAGTITATLGLISAGGGFNATGGNITVANGDVQITDTTATTTGSIFSVVKNRSGGVITTGDELGRLTFSGYDGTANIVGAAIVSVSSGTIATNRIPADLRFFTHPNSTVAATLRMSINTIGNVVIAAPDSGIGLTVTAGGATVTSGSLDLVDGNAFVGDTTTDANGPIVQFSKSRAGSVINSGDNLGSVLFTGFDGTDYTTGALITSVNSGTIGLGQVAGNLEFYTHPDSATPEVLRMSIAPEGGLTIATPDSGSALTVSGNISTAGTITVLPTIASSASTTQVVDSYMGKVTTTGLTTAAAASQVLTVTNSVVNATSAILVSVSTLGSNDAQMTVQRVVPATGSFDVTLKNNGAQAVNGNVIMTFWVLS